MRGALFDRNRQMHFDRRWPKAHFVIACLITQLPCHGGTAGRCIRRGLKFRLQLKLACEHRDTLVAHRDLFGFRIRHALLFQWPVTPGQLYRNEKLVFRLVAVDVKSGQHRNNQTLHGSRAAFDCQLIRGMNDKLILLGRTEERREQTGSEKKGSHPFRRVSSESRWHIDLFQSVPRAGQMQICPHDQS